MRSSVNGVAVIDNVDGSSVRLAEAEKLINFANANVTTLNIHIHSAPVQAEEYAHAPSNEVNTGRKDFSVADACAWVLAHPFLGIPYLGAKLLCGKL